MTALGRLGWLRGCADNVTYDARGEWRRIAGPFWWLLVRAGGRR